MGGFIAALLRADTLNPTALRRGALFMVGGVNQIIETWLDDPRETTAELATVCANLCVAVARSITRSHEQLAP